LTSWFLQLKFSTSKNVCNLSDKMLHACGGSGFKTNLGIERLLRDSKAGWVMGPTNEVIRNWIGKAALLGFGSLDPWYQKVNEASLHAELKKLTPDQKRSLGQQLISQADSASGNEKKKATESPVFTEWSFMNPFNDKHPRQLRLGGKDGSVHHPGLVLGEWRELALLQVTNVNQDTKCFKFALPKETDHSGCLPGQYVRIRTKPKDGSKPLIRYFSLISDPYTSFGFVEFTADLGYQGQFSHILQEFKVGSTLEFEGPMGGFEYDPNCVQHLALIAGSSGIIPCLQLIRSISNNKEDKTKVSLLYFSEEEHDVLYKEELLSYQATNPNISVSFFAKEVNDPKQWAHEKHFTGYISKAHIHQAVNKPTPECKVQVVICGGTALSITTLHGLFEMNFPSQSIFVYGPTGSAMVRAIYGSDALLYGS